MVEEALFGKIKGERKEQFTKNCGNPCFFWNLRDGLIN